MIIQILDDTKSRFGSPYGGFPDVHGDTVAAVLPEGRLLLDRYESGENLAGLDRYESRPDARSRRRQNLTDKERERRSQRMRDYREKKWRNDAETTAADV
jgi:hypothetical protein